MRLIDADAIIKVMQKCAENPENKQALLCYRYTQRILEEAPTVEPFAPWHRVEDGLPKDGQECIVAYSGPTDWIYEHATYHSDLNKALEEDIFIEGTDGFIVDGDVGYARHSFNYWMPIEPPKEDA